MNEARADLLSPAFIGGLAGMAIAGTTKGFVVGAIVVWLVLAVLLAVAAIATSWRERSIDALEATLDKRASRRRTAATG